MVQKSAYRVLALTAAVIGLTPSTAGADRAVVRNLEMTREGSRISFLLSFSDQPRAAGVETSATGLLIDVGGLELAVPAFAPPSGGLVRRVTTEPTTSGGSKPEQGTGTPHEYMRNKYVTRHGTAAAGTLHGGCRTR